MSKIPYKPLRLSVFFPCHNEEANVERTTRAALDASRKVSEDFEIIIVNDGSRDRTAEIAESLAREIPQVRVVHHPTNLGYGAALTRGWREARKDWVFYTDGDGQFDFNELPRLVELLNRYDIASAYRVGRKDPIARKLNAWLWNVLVNCIFGMGVRDVDCAFKLYPRKLFEQIELRSTGALIDTEVLAKANYLGYRIGQIGVRHFARTAGKQTGANPKVILRAFVELFRLRKHIRQTAATPAASS